MANLNFGVKFKKTPCMISLYQNEDEVLELFLDSEYRRRNVIGKYSKEENRELIKSMVQDLRVLRKEKGQKNERLAKI